MRILLIEDDRAMAQSIELTLRSDGHSVYTADLGEQGVGLGKLRERYDIIVLDLQLPDMSGFEVLTALGVAGVETPVLILSGNAMVDAKVKALGFGADDYMTKPFHKDELIARVRAIVRRSKRSSSNARGHHVVHLAGPNKHRDFSIVTGGTFIKTEWETGYMLRDLDRGQVVVA